MHTNTERKNDHTDQNHDSDASYRTRYDFYFVYLERHQQAISAGGNDSVYCTAGLPFAPLALVVAIAVELGGGAMLAFGIQTRLAAIGLAIFSIVTGVAFHHDISDQVQLIGLLKNIAIAGGLLHIAAVHAGAIGSSETKADLARH